MKTKALAMFRTKAAELASPRKRDRMIEQRTKKTVYVEISAVTPGRPDGRARTSS